MEGNQVGNRLTPGIDGISSQKATGSTSGMANALNMTDTTNPSATPTEPVENPNPIPDEGLVWPHHLIEEIARARKPKNFQFHLIRILFIIGALIAFAAGPVQLILIAIFQDFDWVHDTYAPLAGKIALIIFILLDLILVLPIIKTLGNLRETTRNPFTNVQPFSAKIRHRTIVYALGLIFLNFAVWLGVIFELAPHIATLIVAVIILLIPLTSLCVQKDILPAHLSYMPLQVFLITSIALSGCQIVLNLLAFYEEPATPIDYAAIERLARAQAAARVEGVPSTLSDLVFAICENQPYSVVFMGTTNPNSGLFECADHSVYSVTAPTSDNPEVSKSTEASKDPDITIAGQAFYFGTTYNPLINRYFPASTGAKYLFRDFRPATVSTSGKSGTSVNSARADQQIPSELVLLLPIGSNSSQNDNPESPAGENPTSDNAENADNTTENPTEGEETPVINPAEENLVTTNLSSIANLLREHGDHELRISIFYNDSLDTVLTTRDFILIAATGTITLNDWLPHGNTYSSVFDGQPATYKFDIDHDLSALIDLGADPTLYSEQTRNAIKSNRHISTTFSGTPTSETLRAQLLGSFIEP